MIRNEFGGQKFPKTQSSYCLSVCLISFFFIPTRSMYFVYEYLLGIVELFGSLLSTTKRFWDANEQSKTFAGFLCLFVCVWVLG